MSRTLVYRCDVCAVLRAETNHWVLGRRERGGFTLRRWSMKEAARPGTRHYCGAPCALRDAGRWAERALAKGRSIKENGEG